LLILTAVLFGAETPAEVRAITDADGNYVETRFLFQETQTFGSGENIWTPVGWSFRRGATLNPRGDIYGDSWPVIGDTESGPIGAWAVWSRSNQFDYELVWSRFVAGGWRMPAWVYPSETHPGHDLDPALGFDASARPYLVWWRDEEGQGRVYLSMFLITQWMLAYPVSQPELDARYPYVDVGDGGEIRVTFETAEGTIEQTVLFDDTVTITDDIDPLDCMTQGSMQFIGESTP
jgi:hypothetical protein